MLNLFTVGALILSLIAQTPAPSSRLSGVITDSSGGVIPGPTVHLRGPGGKRTRITGAGGQYSFAALAPGNYDIQVAAPGFRVEQRQAFDLNGATVLNFQLTLAAQSQAITVQETVAAVSVDPGSNASALVLGKSQLDALSDDPDELSQQLQALAGPGAGPQGGQILTDGFTGAVPPKSSIREIRINSNPFSSEYDSPGFGRIEILTKPGSDTLHGQFSTQYNNESFNTRSPLFVQSSSLPPYKNLLWNGTISGPLKKDKASFTIDFNRRDITENAFIFATNLDAKLNPQTVNQAVLTPQQLTRWVPRLDLTISANQTLIVRYENTRQEFGNLGVGGFRLNQTAYNQKTASHTLQVTETALVNPMLVNETRFQFNRSTIDYRTDRQVHQFRQRDVNGKLPGTNLFPYGDTTVRMLTESTGLEWWQSLQINPTLNFKKFSMYGYYGLSFVSNDFESLAANPYNVRAEWGPGWGDSRQYVTAGSSVPLPFNMTANVVFVYRDPAAYNITTGLPDPSGDGSAVQRPALLNLAANGCTGAAMKYTAQFGCFDLQPAPGAPTIHRNYGRGPGNINMTIRLSKTWGLVKREVQDGSSPNKENLTLSVYAINPFNHPNFAAPNGDLTSPFFGEPLSLQGTFSPGNATYNRKITMQLQWTF